MRQFKTLMSALPDPDQSENIISQVKDIPESSKKDSSKFKVLVVINFLERTWFYLI